MTHNSYESNVVADRVPVDIQGLRDEIEAAYPPETFWSQLSLSQKIRHLILIGLKHKDEVAGSLEKQG